MKIAIASSGLGHIRRGIETWASDLGNALHRRGEDVTLFVGDGDPNSLPHWQEVLPCARRFDPKTIATVAKLQKLGGWRYGYGSGYEMEQTTFTLKLWRHVRKNYDLLHVQDPWIALLMERLNRRGLSRPRVILAHGTEESTEFLRRFSILQHLAPSYAEDWKTHAPPGQKVFAIGNFVKTELFHPVVRQSEQEKLRAEWNLPDNALIVLCVAAIKSGHKRMDVLIREFGLFEAEFRKTGQTAQLVIAGAKEDETEQIIALGKSLLGDKVTFLIGVPREKIPDLYRTADVFALASLHEMMPIAVLEALASGLPVALNRTPTLCWMAGGGGQLTDIAQEGALAAQLHHLSDPETRRTLACAAREHAENEFSEAAITDRITAMYREILEQKSGQSKVL